MSLCNLPMAMASVVANTPSVWREMLDMIQVPLLKVSHCTYRVISFLIFHWKLDIILFFFFHFISEWLLREMRGPNSGEFVEKLHVIIRKYIYKSVRGILHIVGPLTYGCSFEDTVPLALWDTVMTLSGRLTYTSNKSDLLPTSGSTNPAI